MDSRKVPETAVVAVLEAPTLTWHDPKEGSMVLTGKDGYGRDLLVWVVGDHWPMAGIVQIKSTSWKDEE